MVSIERPADPASEDGPRAAARPGTGAPQVVGADELRRLMDAAAALPAARRAFQAVADGEVTSALPWRLGIPTHRGEIHVKGAYLTGSPYIAVKLATGFDDNPDLGLPAGSGFVAVLEARTGRPALLLLDDGYLTDLRTAAAGALAADLLARDDISTVAVIGCGAQARYQLDALRRVRRPARVLVWGRRPERVAEFAAWTACLEDWQVDVAGSVRAAVETADLVVTVTSSTQPLVDAQWLRPGQHLTAVGSDNPVKRELDPAALRRADVVVVDDLEQSAGLGELKGLDPGAIGAIPLAEIVAGRRRGRTDDEQITIADLTGIGAQDAAIAEAAAHRWAAGRGDRRMGDR